MLPEPRRSICPPSKSQPVVPLTPYIPQQYLNGQLNLLRQQPRPAGEHYILSRHALRHTVGHRTLPGTVRPSSPVQMHTSSPALLSPTQTFVMTKLCFQALPMSSFTRLQKRVFPVYFRLQSLLFLLIALTHPPYGPVSLISSPGDLLPLGVGGGVALLNLLVWGPRTQGAMRERIHQGM